MEDACSWHRKLRNVYTILVGWPEYTRPPGRFRRRWEDNIKVDLGEFSETVD
jgi:hypothetical protein